MEQARRGRDETDAQLKQVSDGLQRVRAQLVLQERRLTRLLEEAGKRLPDTLAPEQLRVFADEAGHKWEAFYASFEEQFRGRPEDIKEQLKVYLPYLRQAKITTDILDLGCGRGEWLELLSEEGLQARGVDTNRVIVEQCQKRGLDVVAGDMIEHLRSLPDHSLRAVTAFHLIEHLPFETVIEMLDEIMRTLKPGGLVILETPSPENIVVAACNFYSDPTHHRPVCPHTLTFVLENRGFADVRLEFLRPVEDSPFADDQKLKSLHTWFYGPRDYAVMGSKA